MSHDIEINEDGKARFAYAITGGAPWHLLGTPMKGLGTVDQMLTASQADYQVHLTRVAAVDDEGNFILGPNGKPVIVEDSRATIREDADGTFTGLATVGTRYVVKQNREVAERALAVVGASAGEAVLDTAGVLADGKRFFMTIDLGPLVIDPMGVNDRIARYLVVSTGHDGVWPVRYANTDIRAVCNNTVRLGLQKAERVFVARHTKNIDSAFDDAQEVLRISVDWATEFKKMAEQMLSIPVTASSGRIDKVLNSVFPIKASETERQKNNREKQNQLIRAIYESDKNAGGFGHNGWAIYNAIGEYLDHHRDAELKDRAFASLDDNSWVTRTKIDAQRAVLALV
jgi:phage/plasmid-like protein (TIGR03299 family)